jgi:predicted ABC-type exoprotein transport system permease subunit
MLPFDRRPWARQLAATVIVVTLIAAICVPIILHRLKALDPPIIVGIVLLLLAIIPPNIVVLRQRGRSAPTNPQQEKPGPSTPGPRLYTTRPASR